MVPLDVLDRSDNPHAESCSEASPDVLLKDNDRRQQDHRQADPKRRKRQVHVQYMGTDVKRGNQQQTECRRPRRPAAQPSQPRVDECGDDAHIQNVSDTNVFE